MHSTVPIVGALIGIVVLFFGRKLFWLCVAAVGFLAGIELAPHLVNEPSPLLQLAVAIVLGLLGALLAFLLQKIAIAIVGFLAGGKLAGAIAASFFVHYAQYSTIIFVVGALIGAILLLAKRNCPATIRIDHRVSGSCNHWDPGASRVAEY